MMDPFVVFKWFVVAIVAGFTLMVWAAAIDFVCDLWQGRFDGRKK